jgi:hypothetical protein
MPRPGGRPRDGLQGHALPDLRHRQHAPRRTDRRDAGQARRQGDVLRRPGKDLPRRPGPRCQLGRPTGRRASPKATPSAATPGGTAVFARTAALVRYRLMDGSSETLDARRRLRRVAAPRHALPGTHRPPARPALARSRWPHDANTLAAAQACGYRHVGWAAAGFLGDELPSETYPNSMLLRARSSASGRRHRHGPSRHLVAQGSLRADARAADRRPQGAGFCFATRRGQT